MDGGGERASTRRRDTKSWVKLSVMGSEYGGGEDAEPLLHPEVRIRQDQGVRKWMGEGDYVGTLPNEFRGHS